jgi:hypothetical protein|tara:strand:- start:131 stop:937 length:807 start_codon:yes stop_codon:yes gene_type:complete
MNKLYLSTIALLLLSFLFSFTANAGLISGNQLTFNGRSPELQGLEWLSLDYTKGLSRNEIENGFTDNYNNTWDSNEWRYATRHETETLISSLWGGNFNGWSEDNADGAKWFLEHFGLLSPNHNNGQGDFPNSGLSIFLFGDNDECFSGTDISCIGDIQYTDSFLGEYVTWEIIKDQGTITGQEYRNNTTFVPTSLGRFDELYGLNANINDVNFIHPKSSSLLSQGSLLVRNSAVNVTEPSTLLLFLTFLVFIFRRINLYNFFKWNMAY